MKQFSIFFCLFLSSIVICQQDQYDSLIKLLKKTKNDTIALHTLVQLTEVCEVQDILKYAGEALKISDRLLTKNNKSISSIANNKMILSNKCKALNNIGFYFEQQFKPQEALIYYERSLKIREQTGDKEGLAESLSNVGTLCFKKNDTLKALAMFQKSLKLFEELNDDNGIALTYNKLGDFYKTKNSAKAIHYYQENIKLLNKTGNVQSIANSIMNLGGYHMEQGNATLALEQFNLALKLYEGKKDQSGIANTLNAIGILYKDQGNIQLALSYFEKSLRINEKAGNKRGTSYVLNNIADTYRSLGDIKNSLDYNYRSLGLREQINDKQGIAMSLNNIGVILQRAGSLDEAMKNFKKSLALRQEIGDKNGIANSLNNIGTLYLDENNHEKALEYGIKSLEIRKEISDKNGISWSYINLTSTYLELSKVSTSLMRKKNLQLARICSDSALYVSKQIGYIENLRNAERIRSKIDSAIGDYSGAFAHYKFYIRYRDSIANKETRKAGIKNQLKYEFDKKEAILKEQQDKERLISTEKEHIQKMIIWSVVSGLCLVILFSAVVYRSLKTVSKQKVLIEEKQKEILDSIHYAKRIQKSLLPTDTYIHKRLNKNQLE